MAHSSAPDDSIQGYSSVPTCENLRYGPHDRNVLDYWQPRSGKPAPLVMYIHGGGFRAGDKANLKGPLLDLCLDAGWAFATINYRLSHQACAPAFQLDGARALQFLRAKASELKFDPHRVGLCGSSAGAGIALWVAFHDDLANPAADDPVERQSTRVNGVAIRNGQCSYDPRLFRKLGLEAAIDHPFIELFYGMKREQFDTPEAHAAFDRAAAITYVRRGTPPVFSWHSGSLDPVPTTPDPDGVDRRPNIAVHHPRLSIHLKQKLDEVGTECQVETQGRDADDCHRKFVAFFRRHL